MAGKIECPECGSDRGVRRVELFSSWSFLCPQQGCSNFDQAIYDAVFKSDIEAKAALLAEELEIVGLEEGPLDNSLDLIDTPFGIDEEPEFDPYWDFDQIC